MMVTFGRIGRAFLLAGVVAFLLAVLAYLLLDGSAGSVGSLVLGIVGAVVLLQGVVWTVLQHRMFGSVARQREVAACGPARTASIVAVHSTASSVGAEPIVRLDLRIDGVVVRRHVRVPFNHATDVRVGRSLPVRIDPAGSRAMLVEWERLG